MTPVEILTLAPLAALVVVFGVFPGLLLDLFGTTVTDTVASAALARRSRSRRRSSPAAALLIGGILGGLYALSSPARSPAVGPAEAGPPIELAGPRHDQPARPRDPAAVAILVVDLDPARA